MKEKQPHLFYWFEFGFTLIMLISMDVYFSWEMTQTTKFFIDLFVAVLGWNYLTSNPSHRIVLSKYRFIAFLLICFVPLIHANQGFHSIFYIKPTLFILLCIDEYLLKRLLRFWTNIYSIILLLSLITWVLIPFGIVDVIDHVTFQGGRDYLNYGLCVVPLGVVNGVVRFCSVFREPGHLAMICAFTIFANKYNYHKISIFIMTAVLFISMSLAGYVLFTMGLVLNALTKTKARQIILYGLCVGGLIYFSYNYALTYNNGHNYVNELIIERLEYDEEKGIAGNNRFTESTDYLFDQMCSSGQIVTGLTSDEFTVRWRNEEIIGAGYKIFLIQNGIIGLIMTIIAYWLLSRKSTSKRALLLTSVLFLSAFLQRAYPFWDIWIYLFMMSCIMNNSKDTELIDSKI